MVNVRIKATANVSFDQEKTMTEEYKDELEEAAEEVEIDAAVIAEVGIEEVVEGMETLDVAGEEDKTS